MPTPRKTAEAKKQEWINGLISARESVLAAARLLPEDRLDEPFVGIWCVKDLLAHLAGWDDTNLQAVREILAGQYPSFFQHYDRDWQTYNQRLVAQHRQEPFAALLAAVGESHRLLIQFLQSLDPQVMVGAKARSQRGRTVTIRNLLLSEAADEQTHAAQVAAFARTPPSEEP